MKRTQYPLYEKITIYMEVNGLSMRALVEEIVAKKCGLSANARKWVLKAYLNEK